MKALLTGLLLLGLSLSGKSPAQAADFNCALARLPAEFVICHDDELWNVDETNAAIFYKLRDGAPRNQRQLINASERSWLRERNSCAFDRECIADAYATHMTYLCDLTENFGLGISECEEEITVRVDE